MAALELESVSKRYGDVRALDQVTLAVERGETLALLGPSGCGKSTLLSLVAGLESGTGSIRWDGRDLANVPAHQRDFGLVFQDYALFPHLDVFENVAFGPRVRRVAPHQRAELTTAALALVGLGSYGRRDIATLSGGERQRVALARALALSPRLVMLDEPLAALDRNLRERLAEELATILSSLGLPAIFVTHDLEEALAIADRIVVMRAGRVQQMGSAVALFRRPNSAYTARFLGMGNLLPVKWTSVDGRPYLSSALGLLPASALRDAAARNVAGGLNPSPDTMTLLLRQDAASLASPRSVSSPERWIVRGVMVRRTFRGVWLQLTLDTEGGRMHFRLPADSEPPEPSSPVAIGLDPRRGACLIPA